MAPSGDPTLDFFRTGQAPISDGHDLPRPGDAAKNPESNDSGLGGVILHSLSGAGSSIIGGWRGLSELAQGNGVDAAADAVRDEQQNRTFTPEAGSDADKAIKIGESGYNPLTWPGIGAHKLGSLAESLGASPGVSTAVETTANAVPLLFGLRGGGAAAEAGGAAEATAPIKLTASGAPRLLPVEAASAPVRRGRAWSARSRGRRRHSSRSSHSGS